MAFNGLCTVNDMRFSSEVERSYGCRQKLKSPKSSYEIIYPNKKKIKEITKVEFNATKEISFNKDNIPKWLELSFYSIPKKGGKKNIISLHILNKCLISKNPFLKEPNLILFFHENNIDLLRLIPFLLDISIQMKCDIVSFDYTGFGCSSGKPNLNSILEDGEDALNFAISYLKHKIENITLFGKGIGAMSSIYLASKKNYCNCKSLILCMPEIGNKLIDIKVMRSIICPTLLILELDNKDEIEDDEIINLFREISIEKEWFPIRKKNKKNSNFLGFEDVYDNYEDVYGRHREKFILKIKDYIYPEKDNKIIRKKSSTIGGSTDSDSYSNFSNQEKMQAISLEKAFRNKKMFNSIDINFIEKYNDNKNTNQMNENDINNEKSSTNKKNELYNDEEIEINNDEDY